MQNLGSADYASIQPVTPSNSTLINCRALQAAGAGTLVITQGPLIAPTTSTITVVAGTVYAIELNQGIVGAGSTATGIVALG